MRQTIELLRKQSVQAGLTSAHMISMGVPQNGVVPPSLNNTTTSNQVSKLINNYCTYSYEIHLK